MKDFKKMIAVLLSGILLIGLTACSEMSYSSEDDSDYSTDHTFRSESKLEEHYEKHGIEMGFDSPEEYQYEADKVIHDSDSLHKTEKEDGDDVYYLKSENELVIVSTDGYIRTFFEPDSGISYYYRQ